MKKKLFDFERLIQDLKPEIRVDGIALTIKGKGHIVTPVVEPEENTLYLNLLYGDRTADKLKDYWVDVEVSYREVENGD